MRNLIRAVVLRICFAGLAFAQSPNFDLEPLPAPPELEHSAAELMSYWQQDPVRSLISTSSRPDPTGWDGVKCLSRRTQIRVVDEAFKKTKGRFLEATDRKLVFKANGKVITLDRENVRMVSLRTGPSTGERLLGGLLAGAIVGAMVYAQAHTCEKHGCWDDRSGEWYEGTGKAPSARTAYISAGAGAVGMGVLAAHAKPEDVVIYFQQEQVRPAERPKESAMVPVVSRVLEGGNIFAPVTNPSAASW